MKALELFELLCDKNTSIFTVHMQSIEFKLKSILISGK